MKVNLLQHHDMSLKQGYHSVSENPASIEKMYGAGLRENNNKGYEVVFSGSGASKKTSEAAAKVFNNLGNTISDKILGSEKFKKLLEVFEEKTVVAQALVALVVAGVLRPATNMAMAGKNDREDSMYAAAHAISSAVIGFVVSSIVMAPFDKAFKKIKNDPKKYLSGLEDLLGVKEIGKRKLEKSKPYKNISKVAQMIPDSIILGVPKAMMTIALIPPVLKYVFGWEKKPKNQVKPQQEVVDDYSKNLVSHPVFAKFKGGNI